MRWFVSRLGSKEMAARKKTKKKASKPETEPAIPGATKARAQTAGFCEAITCWGFGREKVVFGG